MPRPSIHRDDPKWLSDLDIDPSLRDQVRKQAIDLHTRDIASFSPLGPAEKSARQRRLKLKNPWLIQPWIVYCLGSSIVFTVLFVFQIPNQAGPLTRMGIMMFILVIGLLVTKHFQKQQSTPYLSAALRHHGIVICPGCGYHHARQPSEPICPECGLVDPPVE